jgi:flavin reductase (DIM6/NTAB) family NADH-FMN oxidoreductase RutF/predicted ester cyclase
LNTNNPELEKETTMFANLNKTEPACTPEEQRKIFSQLPTGVVAITGLTDEGKPTGFVVGTFQSLSLEPALVTFCVAKTSSTWPVLRARGRFTANVLANTQVDVCKALGRKGEDKFKGLAHEAGPLGTPRLAGSVAWIDCQVLSEVVAGDHFMIVGSVVAITQGAGNALVFNGGKFSECTPVGSGAPALAGADAAALLPKIADAWARAWGQGETAAFQNIVAPDYVRHSKTGEQVRLPAMLRQIEESHVAFSDFKVEILHAIDEGDLIALHWRTTALHTGMFMDVPPTHRKVTVQGASFLRHRNGLITEEWVVWDPRELLSSMDIWHLGDQSAAAR